MRLRRVAKQCDAQTTLSDSEILWIWRQSYWSLVELNRVAIYQILIVLDIAVDLNSHGSLPILCELEVLNFACPFSSVASVRTELYIKQSVSNSSNKAICFK
ncbi:MAG: hypothetical protein ACJAQ4_000993 [Cryomorphaceae bacterium]|jgi:hypothetical protein